MKTNKKHTLILVAVIAIISSCTIISFYPLYTEDVLIRDDRIIGEFSGEVGRDETDETDTLKWEIYADSTNKFGRFWEGSRKIDKFRYILEVYRLDAPESKAIFEMFLVELDSVIYADLYPYDYDLRNNFLQLHLVNVHTFCQVRFIGKGVFENVDNGLGLNFFNLEVMGELIDSGKIRIKHENNGSNILLTAQPKELQDFIIKYATTKNAYDENMRFVLIKE